MDPGPVWVCVPTYDEADHVAALVPAVLRALHRAGLDAHVLVIDDDSPDGTGAIADELAARDPRVEVLHRERKEGIGPAYRAGFRHALAAGARLVCEMDCDFSHDPEALPALVAAARHADVVLGSRYVPGGAVQRWGPLRRALSRGGCWYARRGLGVEIADLTGGFKCFRREVLETVGVEQVRAAGYAFQIEVTYRALLQGYHVVEVPIVYTERTAGESKMSRGIVLEAAGAVLRLRLHPPDTRTRRAAAEAATSAGRP